MKVYAFIMSGIVSSLTLSKRNPCDFAAYRMRYGDECEGKMLDAKGDSGDKVMQLIKDANTLLEVTYKQINKYFNNFQGINKPKLELQEFLGTQLANSKENLPFEMDETREKVPFNIF